MFIRSVRPSLRSDLPPITPRRRKRWGYAIGPPLPSQRKLVRAAPGFPLRLLQFGLVAFRLGIADAEIGDEFPGAWHVENGVDAVWTQDRDPAEPDTLGTCGEPHCGDRRHHGVFRCLGHGRAAEAVADIARLVREHREVARCLFQARELERGITGRPFAD